jgi:DNA-directed RNA polymerase subunit L
MKLKIIRNEGSFTEMALGGEGHTLLNLLQSFLLQNKNVDMAGYSKPHPLMDRSVLYLTMKEGKAPMDALLESAEDAKKNLNMFIVELNKQIEELKNLE